MSTPARVAGARLALGRRLASLRETAGLTQAEAAARIRYSRSAVARAETRGVCSREFCRLAGQLYGTGDDLAAEHDRTEVLALAARSQAARQTRQRRHPPPRAPALPEQNDVTVTALEAACPYCGKPVSVLTRQGTALLPLGSPEPMTWPIQARTRNDDST
jgi:transcriptional regulator with XRE-family HTH domain